MLSIPSLPFSPFFLPFFSRATLLFIVREGEIASPSLATSPLPLSHLSHPLPLSASPSSSSSISLSFFSPVTSLSLSLSSAPFLSLPRTLALLLLCLCLLFPLAPFFSLPRSLSLSLFSIKREETRGKRGEERGEGRDNDFSYFTGLTTAVVTGAGWLAPFEER